MAKDFNVFDEDEAKEYDEKMAKSEGQDIESDLKAKGTIEAVKESKDNTARDVRAERVKDFTTDDEIPEPIAAIEKEMILVQEYGGRFRTWSFDNLDRVQGFASSLKGKKRLFRKVEGQEELQEINAMGTPVKR